jgi:hypothetical protein
VRAAAQRGGTAILAAFLLLVLMAGAGLATSRNVVRDLAMGGDAVLGARAACAADSGLEWFLAWAREDPENLRTFLAGLEGEAPGSERSPPGTPLALETPETSFTLGFQLRVGRLGAWTRPGAEGEAEEVVLWRVRSTGQARSAAQAQDKAFVQARELVFSTPPPGPSASVPEAGQEPGSASGVGEAEPAAGSSGHQTGAGWQVEPLGWRDL